MSSTGTLSLDRFSPDAKAWVVAAQQLADESQHAEVTPLHLLHTALDRNPAIAAVFEQAGKSATKILALTGRALAETPKGNESAYLSAGLLALLRRAERDAERAVSSANKEAGVDLPHLLNALTQEIKGPTADILGEFDLGPGSLKPHLATLRSAPTAVNPVAPGDWAIEVARSGASSAHGDPVIGREEEIQRVLTVLERREQCNPILIGETGIGKAAIVRGVLQRVNASRVPSGLGSARWLEPDLGALASLARTRLEADVRFKKLIDSQRREQPLILVLTSIVRFLGSAPGATIALGDALTSALERRTLRVLATTSVEGWSRITSKEPMLARLFTPIPVDEPNLTQATDIVRGLTGRYEQHHKVEISEPAVTLAVQLAKRYIPERALPESALGLLDESAAARRVAFDGVATDGDRALTRLASLRTQHDSLLGADDTASVKKRAELMTEIGTLEQTSKELEKPTTNSTATPLVGEQEVAATLAKWTQIPVAKMLEAEAEKLLKMEERLARRVVGQQAAVEAIARAVRRGRVGLRDPRRPIGSFLFLGTSGVGKTELAKALAEFLFDDEHALTRLDMSEFMERHMAQRLLGAPPGYADSDQGGFLTEAVRKRPYSVLLFDEVEKAHQDVFNLLLQVLDDGRLTDGRGRLADFTNTVVILTSNIGSEKIIEADPTLFETREGRDTLRGRLMERLQNFFRPEFLNRIGDTVVFRPLDKDDLLRVVEIQLARIGSLLAPRGLTLNVDDAAKRYLVDRGYEPALGARPLQRSIVRNLQDPLAESLLRGGFTPGQTVNVVCEGDALHFRTS